MNGPSAIGHPEAGQKRARRTRWGLVVAALIVIVAAGAILAGWLFTKPKYGSLDQELGYRVASLVGKDKAIKNATLYVMKGDGSFTWSGAAGIANQDGQAPMTKDTPIYIASVTKLYTAAAIMRLVEQGKLALDDPMSKYLPDELIRGIQVYQGHDYSHEITIEQLLAQTSGIADYYDEKPAGGQTLFEMMLADPTRVWTVDEEIARARDQLQPNFVPGTAASYSDTNYQLLATGKPLQEVYQEFFFRPLNLTHTWLVGRSEPQAKPAGAPADVFYKDTNISNIRSSTAYWADGGIVSPPEEMVVFLKALNDGKIVSRDTLQQMHNWRPLRNLPFQYGYGTMRFALPAFASRMLKVPPVWGHTGSTGSFLYYAPDLDLYMAGTIDQTNDRMTPIMLMMRVMGAVRRLQ
jgi:D-alanyl-D-alanine carboxypeptidase